MSDRILADARHWPGLPDISDISSSAIQQLTVSHGIDFATAVLYDRLSRRSDVAEMLSRYAKENPADRAASICPLAASHLAVVPGALYREYPQTGAGGHIIMIEAERQGCHTELVPVSSTASPHDNAIRLCEWLNRQERDDLILVSLSKGGADVKCAMSLAGAEDAFDRVRGWINFGGILDGAPIVEWACSRWLTRNWYRGVCILGGYDFNAFTSLRRGQSSPLDFSLRTFSHIETIHVIGVPLRRHLSSHRAKRWHRRLARWGPNDSVTLLTDVIRWPGKVFPVWGTDHYWQERWDARRLIPFLLRAASSNLSKSLSFR